MMIRKHHSCPYLMEVLSTMSLRAPACAVGEITPECTKHCYHSYLP